MSATKITVFTNVLNEEQLISPWLDHHIGMFDHGVVIDYGCRDRTLDIIRERCPSWEIVKNKRVWGNAYEDIEELEGEARFDGWKIALNTTEFLMTDDLRAFITRFERDHPTAVGIRTCGVNIVARDKVFDGGAPFMKQFHWGFFEHNLPSVAFDKNTTVNNAGDIVNKLSQFIGAGIDGRTRLLHKTQRGMYNQGRHSTRLENIFPRSSGTCPESELYVCWLGYAPYSVIESRTQQRRHTYLDFAQLYQANLAVSHDLLDDERYRAVYERMYGPIIRPCSAVHTL